MCDVWVGRGGMGVGYSSDDDPGTLEFGRESKEKRKTMNKHSSATEPSSSWWGMIFMVCEMWLSMSWSSPSVFSMRGTRSCWVAVAGCHTDRTCTGADHTSPAAAALRIAGSASRTSAVAAAAAHDREGHRRVGSGCSQLRANALHLARMGCTGRYLERTRM